MSITWELNQENPIAFVLVDVAGVEVVGVGNGFSIFVSKNGGAFQPGTGVKAEIGSGWYSYIATALESDTLGPASLYVTAPGTVQQNLLYEVVGVEPITPPFVPGDLELAEYMVASIGSLAGVLGLTTTSGLIVLGVAAAIADAGTGASQDLLNAHARLQAWRAVMIEASAIYDFSDDGASFKRSQIFEHAKKMAESEASVIFDATGYSIEVGQLVFDGDPYNRPVDEEWLRW